VEWATFARVSRVPRAGEIARGGAAWDRAAGGGAVAAVRLSRMAPEAHLLTALGDDAEGRRAAAELALLGVHVHAVWRPEPQRRVFVHVDDDGERTITTLGRRLEPHRNDPLPWDLLPTCDAIYFTAGDAGALRAARTARVLSATARVLPVLAEAGVPLDALLSSANDAGEKYTRGDISPEPRLVVRTEGARGGSWITADGRSGRFAAVALPGPRIDTYGAGDSFAAALTFALADGQPLEQALHRAAQAGAAALSERAPYAEVP
jgi:ribokinase